MDISSKISAILGSGIHHYLLQLGIIQELEVKKISWATAVV